MPKIYEKQIWGASILEVAAGTTGYGGGDSGHGGRTWIKIADGASSDFNCSWDAHKKELQIMLGGDSELDNIIKAFEFVANTLKELGQGIMTMDVVREREVGTLFEHENDMVLRSK